MHKHSLQGTIWLKESPKCLIIGLWGHKTVQKFLDSTKQKRPKEHCSFDITCKLKLYEKSTFHVVFFVQIKFYSRSRFKTNRRTHCEKNLGTHVFRSDSKFLGFCAEFRKVISKYCFTCITALCGTQPILQSCALFR